MVKILFHVGHPAHVHFFKHAIKKTINLGNEVYVTAVDKEFTKELLDDLKIPYETVGVHKRGLSRKLSSMLIYDKKFYSIIKKNKIDVATAVGSPSIAQAAYLTKIHSVIFTDTETASIGNKFMAPFAKKIITPECYKGDFGSKHQKYRGYQELAYLHPKYFTPDKSVLSDNGVNAKDPFIVVRFVSRVSLHDIGDVGLSDEAETVFERLKPFGKILVSSEHPLPESPSYSVIKSPSKIHSLLYYASLYIGESPTMATEAALCGTPSIYAQGSFRGYTDELEKKYGLVLNFHNPSDFVGPALDKACEILSSADSKSEWARRKVLMLADKIDVTDYIVSTLLQSVGGIS